MSLSKIYRLPCDDIANRTITSPLSESFLQRSSQRNLTEGHETDAVEQDLSQNAQSEMEISLRELGAELLRLEGERETLTRELVSMEEEAKLRAEHLFAQARDDGFRDGFEVGVRQGEQSVSEKIDMVDKLLRLAGEERARALLERESDVVRLAMQIARRVVCATIADDDEMAQAVIRPLLAKVRNTNRLELRVASADFASVLSEKPDLESLLFFDARLDVVPDLSLKRGDVVLITDFGTMDGRVETRMDLISQALLKVAKRSGDLE